MSRRILSIVAIAAVSATLVTGCARQISPDVYKAGHVGETSNTYAGRIVSARQVLVEDQEYLEDNKMGLLGGGILGGVLGNQMGKGLGNTLATGAGLAAGAAAGAMVEKEAKKQYGMEYVVQLDNGSMVTIVQGAPAFAVGTRVYVMKSHNGRSRIQPMS